MIKNRLAELLAQRQLKITKVAKDTGISRNTITATAQNDGTMIKLETIDVLCNYLGVTPSEFFEFLPVLFNIDVMVTNFKIDYFKEGDYSLVTFNSVTYASDVFLDISYRGKDYTFSLECKSNYNKTDNTIKFELTFTDKQELAVYQDISTEIDSYMFSSKIANNISVNLIKDFKNQLMNYKDESLDEQGRKIFFDFLKKIFEPGELYSLKF